MPAPVALPCVPPPPAHKVVQLRPPRRRPVRRLLSPLAAIKACPLNTGHPRP
jgi:hypothetical protein